MTKQSGYTILELLIFVAVSSLIFVSTMTIIQGRQSQVQFAQAVREFDAKIRDLLNDVTTGYYPTNHTVSCRFNSATGLVEIVTASNQKIGTNSECIYVGKVLQFLPDNKADEMRIYTLAGKRYEDNKLTPVSSIAQTRPQAVVKLNDLDFQPTDQTYRLLYGLKVNKVIRPLSNAKEYSLVGILTDFGSKGVSQAQSLNIGGLIGSVYGQSEAQAVAIINELTDSSAKSDKNGYIEKNTAEGLVICLQDESGRKASVSFGANGSSSTELKIDDYVKGCDTP